MASTTQPSPTHCQGRIVSPSTSADSSSADTGSHTVASEARVPLVRALPAYQSTKPITVGPQA